ncbi:MAG: hypothetical protein MJ209_06540 [archaeon]|nr:hypothetical protein [archaeon]
MISTKSIINENVHGIFTLKPQVCECGSMNFIFDEKNMKQFAQSAV